LCSKEDGVDASDSDDGTRPLQGSVGLISFTNFHAMPCCPFVPEPVLLLLREARASGGTATILRPAFAGEERREAVERKRERESARGSSQEGNTAARYNKAGLT
jgi:hypothetical protein